MPIHEHPRRKWALASVSNSVRLRRIRKVKKIKELRGGPPRRIAQAIPQIDPPEAEKRAIYGWTLDSDMGGYFLFWRTSGQAVALLTLGTLAVSGLLSPPEALSGLSKRRCFTLIDIARHRLPCQF